jgi:hypothetical protein
MATDIGLASISRNQAFGSLSTMRTVTASGVSTRSMARSMYALGLPFTERKRSIVYFTSAEVSSRPLTGGLGCQRTPRRSLKT